MEYFIWKRFNHLVQLPDQFSSDWKLKQIKGIVQMLLTVTLKNYISIFNEIRSQFQKLCSCQAVRRELRCGVFFFSLIPPVMLQLSHNWPVKCAFLSGIVCFMICRGRMVFSFREAFLKINWKLVAWVNVPIGIFSQMQNWFEKYSEIKQCQQNHFRGTFLFLLGESNEADSVYHAEK